MNAEDVLAESFVADRECMSFCQGCQTGWYLVSVRHGGSVDQNGDHSNAAFEGGFDLEPDQTVVLLEAGFAITVGCHQPP